MDGKLRANNQPSHLPVQVKTLCTTALASLFLPAKPAPQTASTDSHSFFPILRCAQGDKLVCPMLPQPVMPTGECGGTGERPWGCTAPAGSCPEELFTMAILNQVAVLLPRNPTECVVMSWVPACVLDPGEGTP